MVDFAVHGGPLKALGMRVIAASVDSVERTADLRRGLQVGFPMYAELDAQQVAAATGANIQTGDREFIHATGFLVDPDGKVNTAVYATGPIGRFWASEVIRKVQFEVGRS